MNTEYYEKKIWLRKRQKNQPPFVVYVSHYNIKMGTFICYVLNTDSIVFSKKKDFIEYDHNRYKYEMAKYKLINSIQTQVHQNSVLKKLRKELFKMPVKTFLFKIKGKN